MTPTKHVEKAMDPLLKSSATDLARRIREGEISSLEVIDAHIRRIQEVNPVVNAIVCDRFEGARAEARAADERRGSIDPKQLPPLHGVPCSIKESFALEGMPNTSGLRARIGLVAERDAVAVARLKQAGAIPLGVSNTSELCMWMESHNKVYGRTRNPYDRRRIVGGSSGGEGAIVGAGGTPFGLGADIGGSIRMPAFFNGVFGHKPTGRLVPNVGQHPIAHGVALRYLCTGPIARAAEDLWPLLKILAGPDQEDTECIPFELGDPDQVDLSRLTVLDIEDHGRLRVRRDLREAQKNAARALEKRGATVKPVRIERLSMAFDIWGSMLEDAGGPSYAALLGNGRAVNPMLELLRWLVGRSPFTLPSVVLTLVEHIPKLMPRRAKRFIREGQALRAELVDRLGDHSVFLFPPHRYVAPLHRIPVLRPFNWVYTAIFNVLEVPVTQVPMGLNRKGLPLGVQVGAVHGNDHLTIAVARALEQDFGGWVPPEL